MVVHLELLTAEMKAYQMAGSWVCETDILSAAHWEFLTVAQMAVHSGSMTVVNWERQLAEYLVF